MVKVGAVYNIVRDLCNKDQKGFVTPAVFNTLARAAQMNVYNEMFNELKIATRLRKSGGDAGRDKSAYKMVEEDLSYFIKSAALNVAGEEAPVQATGTDGSLLFEDGDAVMVAVEEVVKVIKPADLSRIISMNVFETNTSVEIIYDSEKAKRVLNSNLSAPSEEFPIALIDGSNIEIFPQTITSDINIKYYRYPVQPKYVSLSIDGATGLVIEDVANCINFELPDHYLTELVGEIARMIGVRLRDDVLIQYGATETTNR